MARSDKQRQDMGSGKHEVGLGGAIPKHGRGRPESDHLVVVGALKGCDAGRAAVEFRQRNIMVEGDGDAVKPLEIEATAEKPHHIPDQMSELGRLVRVQEAAKGDGYACRRCKSMHVIRRAMSGTGSHRPPLALLRAEAQEANCSIRQSFQGRKQDQQIIRWAMDQEMHAELRDNIVDERLSLRFMLGFTASFMAVIVSMPALARLFGAYA